MVAGASDDLLEAQLKELDEHIERLGIVRGEILNPGLDRDAISKGFASVALPVPTEAQIWFGWADGGPVGIPTLPLPAGLEEALRRYPQDGSAIDAAFAAGLDNTAEQWGAPEGWLRLQASNFAVAMECAVPVDRPPRLRVASVDFVESGSTIDRTAVSLCSVAELCLIGFRADAIAWDAVDGRWNINRTTYQRARAEFGWPAGSLF